MTRFFLVIALLTAANAAQAGFLTTSPTPPTIGPSDVFQASFAAPGVFDAARDFTNNPTPGQSFTTPIGAAAFRLNSITVKGVGAGEFAPVVAAGAGFNTDSWHLRISAITGTLLTTLATESASATDLPADNDFRYYVTFALATPVLLAPGSTYAFDVYSESGYFGLSRVGDVYAGGAAFNTTGVRNFTGTTADFRVTGDRTFFASLSPDVAAVPVPPTLALAIVGLLPLWRAGRRRRA